MRHPSNSFALCCKFCGGPVRRASTCKKCFGKWLDVRRAALKLAEAEMGPAACQKPGPERREFSDRVKQIEDGIAFAERMKKLAKKAGLS